MTVSVFGFASGDHISPGETFFWTCSGPTALDDHIGLIPSVQTVAADVLCGGATSGFGMIGYVANSSLFKIIANAGQPPATSGTVFNWTLARYNHAGSVVESGTGFTGMIYTPDVPTCFNLLSMLQASGGTLDQVLQAVHRVYPAT